MRVAEGNALADERLGRIGREEQRVGCGGGEAAAVEPEPLDEHGQRRERAAYVATRGEHGRLVLLEVAVVGER